MKTAYATPTLTTSGSIVRETLGGSTGVPNEGIYKASGSGSVGFYL
jgi:hypothetical protein